MGIALEKMCSGYFQKAEEAYACISDMRGRGGRGSLPLHHPLNKTYSDFFFKCIGYRIIF